MLKVYLAGPISHLSYTAATTWREVASSLLDPRITAFSPMRGCRYLEGETSIPAVQVQSEQRIMSTNRGIFMRDKTDCITSDILLVYYPDGCGYSAGTAMEIAWANLKNIPIVAVASKTNVNRVHPMIEQCVIWCDSLEEGCEMVNSILLPDGV